MGRDGVWTLRWADRWLTFPVRGQESHAQTVVEVLQSIRQADMTPLLTRIYQSDGGVELLDVLMKYL